MGNEGGTMTEAEAATAAQRVVTISGERLSLARATRFIRGLEAAGDPAALCVAGGLSDADKLLAYLRQLIARRIGGPRGEIINERINAWSRDGRNHDIELTIGRPAPKDTGASWTGVRHYWLFLRQSEIEEAVAALRVYRGDPPTYTVRANVYDGVLKVDPLPSDDDTAGWEGLTLPEGGVFTRVEVGPWGENELGMARADRGLADQGFVRVGPWSEDEFPRAEIRRAQK